MQVAHSQDHVTHAVIGGHETINFGISSSAEFFNILSSTLYKDQILAVVRETLCNAWDAHIEAGCTDKPIEVLLTREKLVIKDFGKGIHHDDMGLIYGTYGNSTKKNDGNQTGGFGLGCKSPFAYTEHFEVISCHAGTQTIYSLSKSSAQAMGKPGITHIASFPSSETGLTVTIHLKEALDFHRFYELVKRIIKNGDMNATFNGEHQKTLNFDVSQGNFMILKDQDLVESNSQILVRYGNVVYPVDDCKEINAGYSSIMEKLGLLPLTSWHGGKFSIVFQAPAHSISVTPSRESLSMQGHTINTLNQLFAGFLQEWDEKFNTCCKKFAEEAVDKAVEAKQLYLLFGTEPGLPILEKKDITSIQDIDAAAKQYITYHYPKEYSFRKQDIARRISKLMDTGEIVRGMGQTFLRELNASKVELTSSWYRSPDNNQWLKRQVIAPLLSKLAANDLDNSRLYVCDNRIKSESDHLTPANQASPEHLLYTVPYLRNVIVLTKSKRGITDRVYDDPDFIKLGRFTGFLAYIAKSQKELEKAKEFFSQRKMRVIDLTPKVDEAEKASTLPRQKREKVAGLPKLSHARVNEKYRSVDTKRLGFAEAPRIEEPEYVIQLSFATSASSVCIPNLSSDESAIFLDLFGDVGGVVTSSRQKESWINKGAKSYQDFAREKIISYVLNSPTIREYYQHSPAKIVDVLCSRTKLDDSSYTKLVILLTSHQVFQDRYGLKNNLTELDKKYLVLWKSMSLYTYLWGNIDAVNQAITSMKGIKLSSHIGKLVSKIISSPCISLLDFDEVSAVMRGSQYSDKAKEKTAQLVIKTIEG